MKNAQKSKISKPAVIVVVAAIFCVAAMAQTAAFRWFGPMTRILTANGDGNNDVAFFCFDNPSDSDVTGKIYSLLGSEVAALGPRQITAARVPQCPDGALGPAQYLTWDGRSNGSAVRSGIYVYRVMAENKVYSGTLIVVK